VAGVSGIFHTSYAYERSGAVPRYAVFAAQALKAYRPGIPHKDFPSKLWELYEAALGATSKSEDGRPYRPNPKTDPLIPADDATHPAIADVVLGFKRFK
jgi:hypothetical protein